MTSILVVDDYAVTQRVLSHTLRKEGYEIVLADDAEQALDIIRGDWQIDLAIFDIDLPGMSGIDLLQIVRDEFERFPIVMLTASGQDEDRSQARQFGADEFLTKPSSSRELVQTISRLLAAYELE